MYDGHTSVNDTLHCPCLAKRSMARACQAGVPQQRRAAAHRSGPRWHRLGAAAGARRGPARPPEAPQTRCRPCRTPQRLASRQRLRVQAPVSARVLGHAKLGDDSQQGRHTGHASKAVRGPACTTPAHFLRATLTYLSRLAPPGCCLQRRPYKGKGWLSANFNAREAVEIEGCSVRLCSSGSMRACC